MARKTKKASVEIKVEPKKYTRDRTKKPLGEIAKRVLSGEFGDEWKYAVRKLGYPTNAVAILVEAYSNGNNK